MAFWRVVEGWGGREGWGRVWGGGGENPPTPPPPPPPTPPPLPLNPHPTPRADHECPVQREILSVRDHALARLDAGEHDGLEPAAGVEKPAAQPDIKLAAGVAVHALECGAAPVRKAEHAAELRALERAVGSVVRRHAGGLRRSEEHT